MMFKKSLDIVSLVAIAVFGSIAIWLAIWGESPREPGHMSIQSKILLWDIAPFVFAPTWLIVRYANAAAARFPFLLGRPGHRGLLFYILLAVPEVLLIWKVVMGFVDAIGP
jgi:hypothetical protein